MLIGLVIAYIVVLASYTASLGCIFLYCLLALTIILFIQTVYKAFIV